MHCQCGSSENRELFALRLLFQRFSARTWEGLPTREGEMGEIFHEAVRQLGFQFSVHRL
jgi:hypothetical protein